MNELFIGAIALPNPVLLAPMSGVTDAPFRRMAAAHGAGLVVSEMTARAAASRATAPAFTSCSSPAAKRIGWLRARGSPKASAPRSSTSIWAARRSTSPTARRARR